VTRRRTKIDGLPPRVYERHGERVYAIGYKQRDNTWSFRLACDVNDKERIAQLRADAKKRAAEIDLGRPSEDSFSALADAWLKWQQTKPPGSANRRAESTLAENNRELETLKGAFGHLPVGSIEKADGYGYLDECERNARGAKGNKEVALARSVLEYGIRIGKLKVNPFDGVEKLITEFRSRLVTDAELNLAVEVGRQMGGPQHICALALKTAWLCLRRSVEVRALSVGQITERGIVWQAAKRKRGTAQLEGLIEWSAELKQTVDEALAIRRYKHAGEWYVFGNLSGERYTKGGWKATLAKLMDECVVEAGKRRLKFERFSLQDCRPKGVTDKLEAGQSDVMEATLHTSERMVQQVYDRRRVRVAKPAK
jgi:integrase